MSVNFSLKINNDVVGAFSATRIISSVDETEHDYSTDPDSVHQYFVEISPSMSYGTKTGKVSHRYGDSVWTLINKGLLELHVRDFHTRTESSDV